MDENTAHAMTAHTLSLQGIKSRHVHWQLAGEVPVSICFGGTAHAVMMASPCDLEDFATGFALSERIVRRADEIKHIEVKALEAGFLVNMEVGEAAGARVSARRRNLPGQASCGICGIIELEEAVPTLPPIKARGHTGLEDVARALAALPGFQPLNAQTHSMHAAAFVAPGGEIQVAREDVGRHNALDKLIGASARRGFDLATGFIIMSSRCSVELVQKVVIAGTPLLATVSAPTALAVKLATDAGLALVCSGGQGELVVAADPHGRLTTSRQEVKT